MVTMSRKTSTETPAVLVGRRIRAKRLELGLSQVELAARARMTVGKLSELENGRSGSRGPTLARLYQIAGALRIPPASLLAT
jgi:XRE family transcriptional regulator, regulator of sulfur utilization